MIKRAEVLKVVAVLIAVPVLLFLSSSGIGTTPVFRFSVISLGTLVGAGLYLLTGIRQLREASRSGTPLLWWKQYHIIVALSLLCLGGALLLSYFIPTKGGNLFINSLYILFMVLGFGLVLYWIILSWPFFGREKK